MRKIAMVYLKSNHAGRLKVKEQQLEARSEIEGVKGEERHHWRSKKKGKKMEKKETWSLLRFPRILEMVTTPPSNGGKPTQSSNDTNDELFKF